jgi:hypothetical protein
MALILNGDTGVTYPVIAGGTSALQSSAGKVLQVVSTTKTDTFTTGSTSFTDITGLSVSITPTSASSKILVMYSLTHGTNAGSFPMIRLVRGSTAIAVGDASGSRTPVTSLSWSGGGTNVMNMQSMNFLDSPSTTSSTTYKLQIYSDGGQTHYINRNARDDDGSYESRAVSTITVMEIAA